MVALQHNIGLCAAAVVTVYKPAGWPEAGRGAGEEESWRNSDDH